MLERSKKYVESAQIKVFMNYDQFLPDTYGKDSIKHKSKIISHQFDSVYPTFSFIKTKIKEIEDESQWFNLGQYKLVKYMQFNMLPNERSA